MTDLFHRPIIDRIAQNYTEAGYTIDSEIKHADVGVHRNDDTKRAVLYCSPTRLSKPGQILQQVEELMTAPYEVELVVDTKTERNRVLEHLSTPFRGRNDDSLRCYFLNQPLNVDGRTYVKPTPYEWVLSSAKQKRPEGTLCSFPVSVLNEEAGSITLPLAYVEQKGEEYQIIKDSECIAAFVDKTEALEEYPLVRSPFVPSVWPHMPEVTIYILENKIREKAWFLSTVSLTEDDGQFDIRSEDNIRLAKQQDDAAGKGPKPYLTQVIGCGSSALGVEQSKSIVSPPPRNTSKISEFWLHLIHVDTN